MCGPRTFIGCTIQALLWKQNFHISISAASCSRVFSDLEGIYFHYICIYLMHLGNWSAAGLRSGLLPGFRHLWAYFPVIAFSMQLAAGDAQQHCKTDPRNFQSAKPEDEKLKSVYQIGRNSIQFSLVLISMKIGLRLHCLKLNLSCFFPHQSVCSLQTFLVLQQMKQSSCTLLLHNPDSLQVRSRGKVVYHHRTKDNVDYIGRGNLRSAIFLHLSIGLYNLMFFTTEVFYLILNVFKH